MSTRRRTTAAIALVLALAAVAFAALALGGESEPKDEAARFVPRDALLYLHLASGREGDQQERAAKLARDLPSIAALRDELIGRVAVTGGDFDFQADVRPWLGDEAAVALSGTNAGDARSLLVLKVGDEKAARAFATRVTDGGTAAQLKDGFVLVGAPDLVAKGVAARTDEASALAGAPAYRELREGLDAARLVHGYASAPGVQALLGGQLSVLAGLPGARNLGASGFSVSVEEERARFAVRSLAPERVAGVRPDCARPPAQAAEVKAPADSLAYLGLARADCALRAFISDPTSQFGSELRRLSLRAKKGAPVDLGSEVLPLLRGGSSVTVNNGRDGAPVATLLSSSVDATRARDVMARLQPGLAALFDPEQVGAAPGFEAVKVDGVDALTAALAPGLEISYAVFEAKLAISTALDGIARARKGEGLKDSADYKLLLGDRPDRASSVLFLDLDKLLAIGDQIGLAEEPVYQAIREDLRKIGAAGAVTAREGKFTTTELLLRTP